MSVTTDHYSYLDHDYGIIPFQSNRNAASEAKSALADGTEIAKSDEKDSAFFGEDGFGFDDFLDIINPLQHLPIISTLYREITGDEISPGSRIVGGGIFGGGIGLAASVINTAIEAETGKDIGEHVIAMVTGNDGTGTDQEIATTNTVNSAVNGAVNGAAVADTPKTLEKQTVSPAAIDAQAEIVSALPATIGLQWKGQAPDLHTNILQASATEGKSLTPDQLSQILGSFKTDKLSAASLPEIKPSAVPAATYNPALVQKEALGTYEKQAAAQNNRGTLVSDSFDYLDRMI